MDTKEPIVRVLQIIDSLELNGGSTMFLDLISAMRRYWEDCDIIPYVVSKTGEYGRKPLVDDSLPSSYGIGDLQKYSYESFSGIAEKERNSVIFHHVLGHTRPIKFHKSCKYYIVNHTLTNIKRLPKFEPLAYICVCRFFAQRVQRIAKLISHTILNGCEDYYHVKPSIVEKNFIIGRCQRVVPSKFSKEKISSKIFPDGYKQYVVGPVNHGKDKKSIKPDKNDVFLGPIFDKQKKLSIVKSFDVYLHNAKSPEGASMAILEALSCGVPVLARDVGGGVRELVIHRRNGMLFKNGEHLNEILKELTPGRLNELKKQTREDFLQRLHIKITIDRYREFL